MCFECPPDPVESAESYLLGRLEPRQVLQFEEHLKACASCRDTVERTRSFIKAMRGAAKRFSRRTDQK